MSAQPTTDLYFRTACADLIAPRWGFSRARPVEQRGANTFVAGDWMIVVRGDKPALVAAAVAWPGRLAYVIDDDIAAAVGCDMLPAKYRARLCAFGDAVHDPLLVRADAVLVPSAALARALAPRARPGAVRRIDPVWAAPLADMAHHAPMLAGGALKVVHLGSGSHAPALHALAPALEALLAADPSVHVTYVAARMVSPGLEAHPHARRIEPKPWGEYRPWLMRQRFHLALYTLLPTGFERARSANKLIEHGIVGAVGVYAQGWEHGARLRGAALTAPADPADWSAALARIVAERVRLPALAVRAAEALADPIAPALAGAEDGWPPPAGALVGTAAAARQRQLWCDLLGLPA